MLEMLCVVVWILLGLFISGKEKEKSKEKDECLT
jgi:hypothetical protein